MIVVCCVIPMILVIKITSTSCDMCSKITSIWIYLNQVNCRWTWMCNWGTILVLPLIRVICLVWLWNPIRLIFRYVSRMTQMWITSVGVENPVVNIIVASVIHTLKWQEDISHNLKVRLWPTWNLSKNLISLPKVFLQKLCSRSKTGVVLTPIVRPVTISFR